MANASFPIPHPIQRGKNGASLFNISSTCWQNSDTVVGPLISHYCDNNDQVLVPEPERSRRVVDSSLPFGLLGAACAGMAADQTPLQRQLIGDFPIVWFV